MERRRPQGRAGVASGGRTGHSSFAQRLGRAAEIGSAPPWSAPLLGSIGHREDDQRGLPQSHHRASWGTACGIAAVTAATVAQAQQQPAGQEPAAQGQRAAAAAFGPRARAAAGRRAAGPAAFTRAPAAGHGQVRTGCCVRADPQTAASTAGQDAAQETALDR